MGGCLSFLMRVVFDALLARIIQEIIKRITGGTRLGWLGALLAFFGIRLTQSRRD